MFKFHMNNTEGLNTVVRYKSIKPYKLPELGYNGKPTQFRRFLATTNDGTHDKLTHRFGTDYAQALIDGDPEIDVETVGQFIGETQRIFLDNQGTIMHCPPRVIEQVLNPVGKVLEERDAQDVEANVNDISPVTWSKIRMKRTDVVRKFAFKRSLQIYHVDGLSYEYLFKIAKDLSDADEMVLLGSGSKGRAPLIFRTNGTPYRGFLEGRVKGKEYQLILHLSNLELKVPEE